MLDSRETVSVQYPAALAGLLVGTLVVLVVIRASLKDVVAP